MRRKTDGSPISSVFKSSNKTSFPLLVDSTKMLKALGLILFQIIKKKKKKQYALGLIPFQTTKKTKAYKLRHHSVLLTSAVACLAASAGRPDPEALLYSESGQSRQTS